MDSKSFSEIDKQNKGQNVSNKKLQDHRNETHSKKAYAIAHIDFSVSIFAPYFYVFSI